ncbi:osteopetrosis-associated transmembrane protein 1-like [Babylonia areolata]|uniref:osteopetrosis-associated transmembrane protein 1-like n=1 Tax=Babylonia areolata TaxID=304850 RepID=UPI003FD4196A
MRLANAPKLSTMFPLRFLVVTLFFVHNEALSIKYHAFNASEPLPFQMTWKIDAPKAPYSHTEKQLDGLLAMEDYEPMENITEICHDIMHNLADQGGNLTHCLIDHARPFRLCEKCIVHYTHFTNLYNDLLNDEHCAPVLLLADRMHVLTTMYNTFTSTWSDADCLKCFDYVEENATTGNVSYNYTTDTLLFREMQANISRCFNDSDIFDSKGVNEVCTVCRPIYRQMNDKFSALQANSNGHICMDLVDMMNYTRLMWSSKFECRRPRPDASIVIAISIIFFLITILLYLSSKFIAKIRMPQIFKAKRMTTKASRYGAISQEEVETSLPGFANFSPTHSTHSTSSVERRRVDSHRDRDGNGQQPQQS